MMNANKTGLRFVFLCVCFGLCFSSISCGQTTNRYWPDDQWRVSGPEEQGIDSETLLEAFRNIQPSQDDFHSLLIIRNGYLITEAYWAPYHRSTTHNVKSATKSIMSALTGIALRKKYLNNLQQTVKEFFPEYVDEPQKKDISLRNLLTMTAGIDWREAAGPSPFDLENWKKLPMKDAPGKRFEYNTMLPQMMSAIITKSSGMSTKDFADKFLFQPLGINNYQWAKTDNGYYHGGSDVFLTPLDMAKFGYLYLNNGLWKGRQIISEKWAKESTTKKISAPSDLRWAAGLDYGFWWWVPAKSYMAWGFGGQYIIVRPDLNLVIVVTGNGRDGANNYKSFMETFLENYIFRAIRGNGPLPPNPKACQNLNGLLQKLENPEAVLIPPMPTTAAKISGRNYILEPNKLHFKSFVLSFKNNNECSWQLPMGKEMVNCQVGLDGIYRINRLGFSMGVNPDGDQVACKGSWISDDTFLIEFHIIGDPSKQKIQLRFAEDKARMNISNLGMDTVINGAAKNSELKGLLH